MPTDGSWLNGLRIAYFKTSTGGPERCWEVEMRLCEEDGKQFVVVFETFSGRLMWFPNDIVGKFASRSAFENLVSVALLDADVEDRNEASD